MAEAAESRPHAGCKVAILQHEHSLSVRATQDMRTTTLSLTDGQMASLLTLFAPLIDAFVDKVADRVRQLQEEAKPRYYTRQQVADLVHVSLPTLHAMVNAGALRPQRVGGRVLFPAAAVDEGIASGALRKSTWTRKGGAR